RVCPWDMAKEDDGTMTILLWHGYLLGGTGSNVYTRALAREWSLGGGHDVVVFSQEPRPEQYDLGRASTVRPEIGGILPTFVLDRYEGLEARLLQDLTREGRERYGELNDEARRDPPNPGNANERLPDEGNAARLARFFEGDEPAVLYFGKLIRNKGVQLLLEAIQGLDAGAVIVGFGDYRAELEALAPDGT